jgi:RNA polymerase sigma factor (sigma-70 family)
MGEFRDHPGEPRRCPGRIPGRAVSARVACPFRLRRTMTPKSLVAPARLAGRSLLGTQTDERLVDLVRAGNETAFEVIVNRYRRGLLRYVARMLPDGRAEDVVQQTFVNAFRAMQSDDTALRLRPWLYRIAHNLAVNALRDRSRMVEELHEDIDGVEPPDHALERRQGLREVLAAVKSLPDRQRSALVLREMEGRSYDEIAAELGVSGGAVRQLLSRAREGVRAAASAITPPAFWGRIPWAAQTEPLAARVAEVCGAGTAGAVAAKLCAGALVTGAVVTGVVAAPNDPHWSEREVSAGPAMVAPGAGGRDARADGGDGWAAGVVDHRGPYGDASDARSGSGSGGGRGGDEAGSRGPGSGDGTGDSSGSGGSGSVDAGSGSDSSGSGSSGSGDSGSGSGSSGSGSSGSGDSGSGSGSSGSGSSGSGDSGSGSGSSESGSSGSGDSGSGSDSSGSGSGSSGSGSSGSGSSGSGSGSSTSGLGSAGTFSAPSDSSGSGSSGSGSGGDQPETGGSEDGGVSGSSG